MEEDILNYSPTVMFRGTPCTIKGSIHRKFRSGGWIYNFLIGCKVKRQGTIDLRKKLLILNTEQLSLMKNPVQLIWIFSKKRRHLTKVF